MAAQRQTCPCKQTRQSLQVSQLEESGAGPDAHFNEKQLEVLGKLIIESVSRALQEPTNKRQVSSPVACDSGCESMPDLATQSESCDEETSDDVSSEGAADER